MKTKVLLLFLFGIIFSHLSMNAQLSPEIRRDIYHSNTLTGFWRLVHHQNEEVVLLNYYKVFQADSSFFTFELHPEKGNLPTAYGYYYTRTDGTLAEHTSGDCRVPSQTDSEVEIEYYIQDNIWMLYRFREKGEEKWNRESYMRVTRKNPHELIQQTHNPDKIRDATQKLWASFRHTQKRINECREDKEYDKAEQLGLNFLNEYETTSNILIRNKTQAIKSSILYDIACCRSLQGRKQEAVQTLAKAVAAGYDSYAHALQDTDLDNIRSEKGFAELLEKMRSTGDFTYILQHAPAYKKDTASNLPDFTYMSPQDENLSRIRKHFNLDSIAGKGDEVSQIKNLLLWVHNTIRHDGSSTNPPSRNAIDLIKVCQQEDRGVNCRMMAIVLNECYLAMGFKSRFVTCLPKIMKDDCHVINAVYSRKLKKWLWMDPTFNAYVMDKKGRLLSIAEVREALRKGQTLVLNEDANWNNKKQTKEHYLDYYMAKNLYYMTCHSTSAYNVESEETNYENDVSVSLIPDGYIPDTGTEIKTTDEKYFWQAPE